MQFHTLVKHSLIISVKLFTQRFGYRHKKYNLVYSNGKEQFSDIPHKMLLFRNIILHMAVYKRNTFLHLSLDFLHLDRESERRFKHTVCVEFFGYICHPSTCHQLHYQSQYDRMETATPVCHSVI